MYYRETIINGILHFKHTPNGKWIRTLSNEDIESVKQYVI